MASADQICRWDSEDDTVVSGTSRVVGATFEKKGYVEDMKLLVTGALGQLGRDVVKELSGRGHEVVGCDLDSVEGDNSYIQMDITDANKVEDILDKIKPEAVIHCAAWTAVDKAEEKENYEKVYAVNVSGTQNLARMCRKVHAKILYISTDYVFDGQGKEPWKPEDHCYAPLNVYGKTKLAGEQAVAEATKEFFIVRISWVFGSQGINFVKTMLQIGKKQKRLHVVCDQIGTPTYTKDLARLLADMIVTEKYGYYHVTNEGNYISWYEFAREIFRQAAERGQKEYQEASLLVSPVTTQEYGMSKATRPLNSRLDRNKVKEQGFQPLPDWKDALSRYLDEIDFREK